MRRIARKLTLWTFHLLVVRPIVWWLAGVRFRRRGLVPKGPCLIVANHNSHLDAALLMSLFPLRRIPHVHPVAAADYFGTSWLKRTMAMLLMNGMPIERHAKKSEADPLQPIADALQAGKSLIFFPEGSRGEAGVVAPFRPGVGRLVRSLPGLLVVPVFLSGPERIWPRGEVVPIPLRIDAIVGRPRRYDPALDAKAIAAKVRSDVLALAPTPPPAPGARQVDPVRVAVCGVEREVRTRTFQRLVRRLAQIEPALGIGETVFEATGEAIREVTGPIPFARGTAWLPVLACGFRTRGRFKGQQFARMVERARLNEALGRGPGPRFVVSDGSGLVDLMAWAVADFYRGVFDENGLSRMTQYLAGQKRLPLGSWWKFIRRAPEVWLINVFDLARPPVPDVLVLVRVPAARVMERLRARGDALQPFDNEPFLDGLQQAYRQVGEMLRRRFKVTVLEFDPTDGVPDSMVDEVEAVCRLLVATPAAASPHG
jgi:1-acyl-sn-glycerol-3-phosphate acyltransferase